MFREQRRLLLDTVILGVVGALSAQLFTWMLKVANTIFLTWLSGYQAPGLPEEGGVLMERIGPHGLWLIPIATTLGGLISGVLVFCLAPEAEGHGTDTVVKAYHRFGGFIRSRVPWIKMVASAIFRSPIGTAFFVIEVLYSNMEFDASALVYTMLASAVAYAVNGLFVGWKPLFILPDFHHPGFFEYPWYIVLGIAAGLVATLLPLVFYGIRDAFRVLPIPIHFKPALGGFLLGILALALPQVLGGGYGWIQEAMDGGALAQVFHQSSAAFVVVGMGAVFAGAARVPVASMLMVTEMTGGYHLLVPAALAVMISYIIQVNLSAQVKYDTLYEAQVPGRSDSPAHQVEHLEAAIQLLAQKHVSVPETVSHLDLRTLLASGIPVDLPDNKRLLIGVLKQDSPCFGQVIKKSFPISQREDLDLVAIFRNGHTILPHPEQTLQAGDRVLVIASPRGWSLNQRHFSPATF